LLFKLYFCKISKKNGAMLLSILKIFLAILISVTWSVLVLVTIPFNKGGRAYHALTKIFARILLGVCGIKIRTTGTEHITQGQSYIYVSNHASAFDIPAVMAGIPNQIRIVYKKELEKVPFFGWALKFGKTYIPIDRAKGTNAARSLEEAAMKFKSGASVLLYGEGTRTKDGKLQPFKRGAFNLAVKAGIPVIPLTINGSYKILPKKKFRIVPGEISLTIEKPIPVKENGGKEEELRLMDEVHNVISNNYIDQ
jgi:1-acyl-sn-glycerol-3-phosphate acyltransferase